MVFVDWFSFASWEHLGVFGYWIVFLCALGESIAIVGLFTPGSFVVVFAGVLAAHGYYDFFDLVAFCIGGAIIGDTLSYEFGRRGKIFMDGKQFLVKHIERGQRYFDQHGGKSVILGRFVGALRPFVPFIAGMSHMPRGRFYLANVIGAIGWSISYISVGFLFGTAWRSALEWWTRIGLIGFLVVALILAAYYWRTIKKHTFGEAYYQI